MPFRVFANPRLGAISAAPLPQQGFLQAKKTIVAWPGYAPTPLRDLPALASCAGMACIRLKDEAGRFGLGSFKALGGAYAVAEALSAELARRGVVPQAGAADLASGRYRGVTRSVVVTCATDGNHGRAVAWGAQRFHCRCVIFLHETVSHSRADAIARYGAEVRRVPGSYDEAVREATRQARENQWFVVSDTSWSGYTEVPRQIMQGYRMMADEAADQWQGEPPTHVFIQAGVGGAAAAVSMHIRSRFQPAPTLIVVEPDRAACLLASAESGEPATVPGKLDTVMAGLACGEPSIVAWHELSGAASAFMAIPDEAAIASMRLLARHGVVGGESGAAGVAGCLLAASDPMARETLGLDGMSRVLVFNTEGATDPELYERLVGIQPARVAIK
ncbi:MAG TPA: diaminopropionate ammonia-lyase [Acetobacteraceae bacterium]|jgi:diaminopropionate ammonia-lyase